MTTFNIGDRIEFTEDYGMSAKTGDQGVITDIDREDDIADIKLDKGGNASAFTFRFKKIAYSTFKVGDRVEFTEDYLFVYKGAKGKVTAVNESVPASENGLITVLLESGSATTVYGKRLKLHKPVFVLGDYAEVWGYINGKSALEGKKGKVIDTYGGTDTAKLELPDSHMGWGTFDVRSLRKVAPPKPATPKALTELEQSTFKMGDKVTIVNKHKGDPYEVALVKATEGKTGTIVDATQNFILVDVEGRLSKGEPYHAAELKHYKPDVVERGGFKVGDKVRSAKKKAHLNPASFNEFGGVVQGPSVGGMYISVETTTDTGTKHDYVFTADEIEKGEVEPSFKVGDFVEVKGHGSVWDGTQGEVTALPHSAEDRYTIKQVNSFTTVYFYANVLVKAERPVKKPLQTFKVGDFVEVIEGYHAGVKAEVESIGEYPGFNYYRLIINGAMVSFDYEDLKLAERVHPLLEQAGVKVGDKVRAKSSEFGGLSEAFHAKGGTVTGAGGYINIDVIGGGTDLALSHEIELGLPVEKTWAEKAEIGDTFVTKDSKGKVIRFLSKLDEDKWVRQYPNTSSLHENLSNAAIEFYADDEFYHLTKI